VSHSRHEEEFTDAEAEAWEEREAQEAIRRAAIVKEHGSHP
jgi:hypothetical protein